MSVEVLSVVKKVMADAPGARRRVLALILENPERVRDESFEALAMRSACSVPTIMRTCRDLGFAGLREFKMALAQELAVGSTALNRRVRLDDPAIQVIAKVTGGAAAAVSSVQGQLNPQVVAAAADALAMAGRVDCYGVGATSNFMANDLQGRLFRLGLMAFACLDVHLQLVSAATIGKGDVVIAISHVGAMPSLLDAVEVARARGAKVIALTQPDTPLARQADFLLGVEVPADPVMPVGPEAYLAHLTVIEILTVLVAQRLGDNAVSRLMAIHQTLVTKGIDMRHHTRLDWAES